MAEIVINDIEPINQYTAAGGETSYDYDFPIFDADDLVVLEIETDGTVNTLVRLTDFSLSGVGLADGGTMTFDTGVYPSGAPAGYRYVLYRDLAVSRGTDFLTGGDFKASTVNREIDKIIMMIQQNELELKRSLSLQKADVEDELKFEIETAVDRADKVLIFGSSGNTVKAGPTSGDISTVAASISNVNAVGSDLSGSDTIGTVAADLSGSDTIGTVAGAISNVNAVGGSIANVNTVATNIANVNAVAADATDIGTVATNITNVNTVAGISANVTTVAGISANVSTVAGDSGDINTLSGISADIQTLADIEDGTMATTAISDLAAIDSNITTVAGISANITSVAGNSSNINTVAGSISDVNTVAGAVTNINTVATNISGVNSFAERYRVAASDPAISLDQGDLAYNTTSNILKYYNGSAWVGISPGITSVADDSTPELGGDLDVNGNSIVSASNGNIPITPNGTGKIILDGLNWPTADGSADQVLKTDGAGNLSFVDAGGGGGAWELLGSYTATNEASIDIYSGSSQIDAAVDSTYDHYIAIGVNIDPAASGFLQARTSTDTGSTFDSGSTDYGDQSVTWKSSPSGSSDVDDTHLAMSNVNTFDGVGFFELNLMAPSGTSFNKALWGHSITDNVAYGQGASFAGFRKSTADVDGLQILHSGGNLSGTVYFYGVKKS